MNKYIENDVRDGLIMLQFSIGNILMSIARKEVEQYELKVPIDLVVIRSMVKDFDPNVHYICNIDGADCYRVINSVISVIKNNKSHCVFSIV